MTADELKKALTAYGADEAGIADRFQGNFELYELCLRELLDGAYFTALADAMRERDYEKAFEAAHAIKGLSGNLGLTAYYRAVCALVEALRAKQYERADGEYAEAARQLELVAHTFSAEKPAPAAAKPAPPAAPAAAQRKEAGKRPERFILIASGVAVLAILWVLLLFQNIAASYQKNITTESAGHLVEINYQLKEYVADQVESDWLIAFTVKSYIVRTGLVDSDKEIVDIMRELRGLWRVSDIILYTDDGYCISGNGQTKANDLASETISQAHAQGAYMMISDSDVIYTIPVEDAIPFNDSTVSAVSVVKDMRTFLDEMGFSSFDSSAYVYLCDGEGAVISRTHSAASEATFNVMSLFRDTPVTTVSGQSVSEEDMTSVTVPTAYIRGEDYVVFTPVQTRQGLLWLAYFVPERVVNRTMSGFSGSVTRSSLLVIAAFLVLALLTVVYINSIRRKQFDKALLAREHMFDLLVRDSQTAFALFNVTGETPTYISSNSLALTGDDQPLLRKTETGFELRSGLAPDLPAFEQVNETLREWDGKGIFRSGFILNAKSVPPNYYEIQLMPVAEDSDEYIGVAQDVTLLHERDAATREALKMAEHASEAKSRFLSNMSHDIRTPMNAIVNMTDFAIEDMANPDKLREHLKTIRESSDHLLMLINDILDMSRIESGNAFIDAAPFNLLAELDRLKSITASLCAPKNQLLITDFSRIRTSGVLGDRLKVSQILTNLLSNAVKFTPKNGGVRFVAEELPSMREENVHLRFTVEDNGIGISKDFLPYIFSPFTRQEEIRVSGPQGTGLGLSICHSYVIAMGGDIRCSSEEGEGTIFTVELYLGKTEAPPDVREDASSMDIAPFRGMRCLLCEDNETNRKIARTLLERLGFWVDIACDGSDGVKAFRRSPPLYYDVIYMDIQMPVMDGYEAAVAIRNSARQDAGTVPIIAMTANVFIEDIEKAHIAGMNGHVGKPVSTVAVANETKKVVNNRRSAL